MTLSCDVLVVGGGILGLWVARQSIKKGLSVIVVDKKKCGAGGSGGILGALLPHLPNSMNHKNKFQYEALVELSNEITNLEEETGKSTDYARCGRLMPIRHDGFLSTVKLCQNASKQNWQNFSFELIDTDKFNNWIDETKAPFGLAWDTLSAKVNPENYIRALKKSIELSGKVIEGFEFSDFDRKLNKAYSRCCQSIIAKHVVISAGYQSYKIIEKLVGVNFGAGIKGQAALFSVDVKQQYPVLYDDGMYVVHHAPNRCAVGSTSEQKWEHESEPEEVKARKFIEKARALCLPLKNAECIGLWAGVRPKSFAKDPIIGQICKERNIWIATGGFKISFGIAHRLAEYLASELQEASYENIALPETYSIQHHIKCGIETGRIKENTLSILPLI